MSNILGKVFGVALIASGAIILHDLSLRRTPEPMSLPIPKDCGETFNCQSSWLSKVLGYNIDSFTLRTLGGGFTSQSYRLAITAPSEEKSNDTLPSSAVVKYTNPEDMSWLMRFYFWQCGGLEPFAAQEIYFYKHMRERFSEIGLRTPLVYYAGIEDHGRRNGLFYLMGFSSHFRALLVMEDLCEHKVFGLANPITAEYAFAAARNLANLHGAFWDDKIKAFSVDKLKDPMVYPIFFTFNINRFTQYPQTKEEVRTRFKNWAQVHPVFQDLKIQTSLETFVEVFPKLLKYFNNNKSTSGPLFKHHTFLHGDYHSGNLFFVTEPKKEDQPIEVKEVITIDWQGYGIGHSATELAYFLSFCEPSMELDMAIMQSYYEELTKKVPKETYSFQVMVREVEIRIFGIGVSAFNAFNDKPETLKNRSHLISRNGLVPDDMIKTNILRIKRMGYVLEKWEKENLIQNLNELEHIH